MKFKPLGFPEAIFYKSSADDTCSRNQQVDLLSSVYAGKGDDNPAPQHTTLEEMHLFLALILKMGHDQHDKLKEYWSRDQYAILLSIPMSCSIIHFFTSCGFYILKTMATALTGIEKIMKVSGN
jgi:hypothetical protein